MTHILGMCKPNERLLVKTTSSEVINGKVLHYFTNQNNAQCVLFFFCSDTNWDEHRVLERSLDDSFQSTQISG